MYTQRKRKRDWFLLLYAQVTAQLMSTEPVHSSFCNTMGHGHATSSELHAPAAVGLHGSARCWVGCQNMERSLRH